MTFSPMAWGLIVYIFGFTAIGMAMGWLVQRSGKRYIVCGKSLPFFFIGTMLFAQALDSNSTMGGAALSYSGGFWAGFTLSIGLGLCLIFTALFFAKPLNQMNLLTLPDFYMRRYGYVVEVLVSLLMAFSFIILVAGNFAGAGWIVSVVLKMDYTWAMILISLIVAAYTISGGLYSCAATDMVQEYPSAIGLIGACIYLIYSHGWNFFAEAIPANYMDFSGLTSMGNGALVNWAAIAALALGDIVALDFMERVFSAKSPRTAQLGCYYGAVWTMAVGVACCLMGMMGRKLVPVFDDPRMILPTIAMESVPFIVGLAIMGGIMAAGASTANGGILGVSTVLGRNILQKNILRVYARSKGLEFGKTDKAMSDAKLLLISRLMAIPVVAAGIWLAHVKPEPGILLILAFDVVFAGCLVPLVLGIYWKKANTPGALASIIVGSLLRLILFYTIPEEWAGLDTLIPPVVSLVVMVAVSLMTQEKHPPKHEVVGVAVADELVLAGLA